jgi:hypothetical protein
MGKSQSWNEEKVKNGDLTVNTDGDGGAGRKEGNKETRKDERKGMRKEISKEARRSVHVILFYSCFHITLSSFLDLLSSMHLMPLCCTLVPNSTDFRGSTILKIS